MKQLMKVLTLLVLVAIVAAPTFAQEKEKKEKQKRGQRGQQRSVTAGLVQKLEKMNLTDKQKAEVKKIVAKYEPKFKEIAKGVKPVDRKATAAARKKAMESGKKGKELRDAMTAAMNLTPEQLKLRKKQQEIQRAMQKEVVALLTPEQQKALRAAAAGKRKVDPEKAKQRRGKQRKKSDK